MGKNFAIFSIDIPLKICYNSRLRTRTDFARPRKVRHKKQGMHAHTLKELGCGLALNRDRDREQGDTLYHIAVHTTFSNQSGQQGRGAADGQAHHLGNLGAGGGFSTSHALNDGSLDSGVLGNMGVGGAVGVVVLDAVGHLGQHFNSFGVGGQSFDSQGQSFNAGHSHGSFFLSLSVPLGYIVIIPYLIVFVKRF